MMTVKIFGGKIMELTFGRLRGAGGGRFGVWVWTAFICWERPFVKTVVNLSV